MGAVFTIKINAEGNLKKKTSNLFHQDKRLKKNACSYCCYDTLTGRRGRNTEICFAVLVVRVFSL